MLPLSALVASHALPWILSASLGCGALFDDPLLELDPSARDSTLEALPVSSRGKVPRHHVLESFGSFGCVSCPEAEKTLARFIHPELGDPLYHPRLAVVNYHVRFGSIPDPWITPATQARNDARGFVSLPQVILDGSNAPYGVREKDAAFKEGDYDTLAARLRLVDTESTLEIAFAPDPPGSPAGIPGPRWDTAAAATPGLPHRLRIRFSAANRGGVDLGPLTFRVIVAKNHSVSIPIYPVPWEAIVMETTDLDSAGRTLSIPRLASLTRKTFLVDMSVPDERPKHVRPPPRGPESPVGYAILVIATDAGGRAVNALISNYHPLSD